MSDSYMLWTQDPACDNCGSRPFILIRTCGESSLAGILSDARAIAEEKIVAVRRITGPTIASQMPLGIGWNKETMGTLPGLGIFHREPRYSPEDQYERATR